MSKTPWTKETVTAAADEIRSALPTAKVRVSTVDAVVDGAVVDGYRLHVAVEDRRTGNGVANVWTSADEMGDASAAVAAMAAELAGAANRTRRAVRAERKPS